MLDSRMGRLGVVRAFVLVALGACVLGVTACAPSTPGPDASGDVIGYGISISRPVMGTRAQVSVFMHSDEAKILDSQDVEFISSEDAPLVDSEDPDANPQ